MQQQLQALGASADAAGAFMDCVRKELDALAHEARLERETSARLLALLRNERVSRASAELLLKDASRALLLQFASEGARGPAHPWVHGWRALDDRDRRWRGCAYCCPDMLRRYIAHTLRVSERAVDALFSVVLRRVLEGIGADDAGWTHQRLSARALLEDLPGGAPPIETPPVAWSPQDDVRVFGGSGPACFLVLDADNALRTRSC
jgi:hypothetical protein